MPGVWWFGGHLGAAVSALVDGQLDEESAEQAWQHVAGCASCRGLVEREGWVKRRLAEMAVATPAPPQPPADLVGSLYDLRPAQDRYAADRHGAAQASWAAVEQLERRHRSRRRAGLAVAGVGSVSAAVLGLSTLGAAPLGIGRAPVQPPPSSLTRATPTQGPVSIAPSSGVSSTSAGVPSPGASASAPAPSPATGGPTGSGAPTAGPFSGWQLRSGEGVNRVAPARSGR